MNKIDAEKRIKELRELTEYYAKKYYDDDDPEISDFEYDMLMLERRNLEKEYPEFLSKDSLTQHVGGHVKKDLKKLNMRFHFNLFRIFLITMTYLLLMRE